MCLNLANFPGSVLRFSLSRFERACKLTATHPDIFARLNIADRPLNTTIDGEDKPGALIGESEPASCRASSGSRVSIELSMRVCRIDCYKESFIVQCSMVTNPVFIVEVASRQIMDGNDAAMALTGYSKAELIGKTLDELYAPETVALILEGCVPRHMLPGTSAVSKIGRGALRTKAGFSEEVELYCNFVQESTPTVLVENRPLRKRM